MNNLNRSSLSIELSKTALFKKIFRLYLNCGVKFQISPLNEETFRIQFKEAPKCFVYIVANDESDFLTKLQKGLKYVVRDMERNPNRDKKHSVIFNA